jgi:hypothetical protein
MLSYFFIYYQEKILKKNPGNGFAMKTRLIHVSSSKRVEFMGMNDVGPRLSQRPHLFNCRPVTSQRTHLFNCTFI